LNDGTATGFVFEQAETSELLATINGAIAQYHDKPNWQRIQRNGMAKDLGWDHSASAYRDIYRSLL
jgi:starch synthase